MKVSWSPDSEDTTDFSIEVDSMDDLEDLFDDEEPTQEYMIYCAEEGAGLHESSDGTPLAAVDSMCLALPCPVFDKHEDILW